MGSHSAVYGKYYQDIVIQSNSFKDIKAQAIHCENYQNCAIVGNTIQKCGGGIEFNAICFAPDGNYYNPAAGSLPSYDSVKTYNAKTVIKNNKIEVKKGSSLANASAIYVFGGKANSQRTKERTKKFYKKTFRLTGVTIQGNHISSAKSAGIYLAYTGSYNVKGNKITGVSTKSAPRGVGIYLDNCSGGKVQSNKISGNNSHGIYLLSSSGSAKNPISLYKNTVDASKKTGAMGLYLKKSKYVDIARNTVSAKSYAVYLYDSAVVTIGEKNAGNTLTSAAKYGIFATHKSKYGISARYNFITARESAVHAMKGSKVEAFGNAVKATSKSKSASSKSAKSKSSKSTKSKSTTSKSAKAETSSAKTKSGSSKQKSSSSKSK